MRTPYARLLPLTATLTACILFVASCSGSGESSPTALDGDAAPEWQLSVTPESHTFTAIADTLELTAKRLGWVGATRLSPGEAEWQSLSPTVVSVDGLGRAVSHDVGTARIVGSFKGRTDTATIHASPEPDSVRLSGYNSELMVGDTVQLEATVVDHNGYAISGTRVEWSTSDKMIANITSGGIFHALAAGTVLVSVATTSSSGSSADGPAPAPPDGLSSQAQIKVNDRGSDDSTPPPSPTSATATGISASEIEITWTDQSKREDEFRIQRMVDGSWTTVGVVKKNVTSFTDASLQAETEYEYRVRACNDAGCGDTDSFFGSTLAGNETEAEAPAAPTDYSATGTSDSEIEITWTDASDNEDAFVIQERDYLEDGTATWSLLVELPADTESHIVTELQADTEYEYRLRACNDTACGDTDGFLGSTLAGAEPTVGSVTVSPSSLSLTEGTSASLDASVLDEDGNEISDASVTWSSSDESIVTVENDGTVQALSPGDATVTATSEEQTGSASVTVTESDSLSPAYVSAFPGAEGFGAMALDACRDLPVAVHKVTSLADGGTGTLRDIIENRISGSTYDIVVFESGGDIVISSRLMVRNPCVYIAGQTAPGGGVQIRYPDGSAGHVLGVARSGVHDVVVRYLRLRAGRGDPGQGDNLGVLGGHHIVFDHLSLQYSNDEQIGLAPQASGGDPLVNVSVQRSIIANALRRHSTALLMQRSDGDPDMYAVSIHHNVFANNAHRNPHVKGSVHDIRATNNVMYNWKSRVGRVAWDGGTPEFDFIGNYMKAGPWPGAGIDTPHYFQHEWHGDGTNASLYFEGNIADPLQTDPTADQTNLIRYKGGDGTRDGESVDASAWRTSRSAGESAIPVTVQHADLAYSSVLDNVGANARLRCDGSWIDAQDWLDADVIDNVKSGGGPATDDEADHPDDFGGYPVLAAGTQCTDSDGDGMSDEFESRYDVTDPTADDDSDGYLNVEEYVNGTDPTNP